MFEAISEVVGNPVLIINKVPFNDFFQDSFVSVLNYVCICESLSVCICHMCVGAYKGQGLAVGAGDQT